MTTAPVPCSPDDPLDPRVARSRAAVLNATLELVAERGIAATSVDAIAERSGVAKTTIYRHWNSKPEVVLDALGEVVEPPPDPRTGCLRDDLYALLDGLVEVLRDDRLGGLLPTVIDAAARDPEFAELHRSEIAGRQQVLRDVLGRAVARGELPEDTDADEVVTLLTGPVFFRRVISHGEVDTDFAHRVVDRVLAAYRPTAH